MSEARTQILTSIRRSLKRDGASPEMAAAVDGRLKEHRRNLVPDRTDLSASDKVDLFVSMVTEVAATVDRLPNLARVPHAVADYLASQNLPAEVKVAPDPQLDGVPWNKRPTLTVDRGRAADRDLTSVTAAFAGIAETGTLMMLSGPEHPTTLNMMPDTHIVVLRADQIVGSYEDGWDAVRRRGQDLPRTVNFITGPSRTGDIEQTIQLGAHGPRRLHILLIDGAGV
ncbi:lactate utilization protein C [Skermanella mucosa]|uniref:LutC/YkgG family protein n=1 Tax=Skermanella mucosa TaxID=1789672 RepID=UPI00192BFEA1|nr:lactate utilization protein C [Skermanella mucosa]UEM21018.1 lactate utilization protein C [Skermanella mucosa]